MDLRKLMDKLNEGISQEDLANAIYNRLERNHPELITRYGMEVVGDSVLDVASFHAGAEEIGTSDIGGMVREVIRRLENRVSEEQETNDLNPNPTDTVKLDVPLLLRIMEYSKEDAKNDMDLHFVTQNLIDLGRSGQTLTMKDYAKVVKKESISEVGAEGSAIGNLAKQKSVGAALQLGQKTGTDAEPGANVSPTGTSVAGTTTATKTPDTVQAAGQQMIDLDPDEREALERIKVNAGLKSQYDALLQKAKTGM